MTEQLKLISDPTTQDNLVLDEVKRQAGLDREPSFLDMVIVGIKAQLQDDKIVMDNVKRAMKKELYDLAQNIYAGKSLYIPIVKWQAFWRKWLGEDK